MSGKRLAKKKRFITLMEGNELQQSDAATGDVSVKLFDKSV